MNKHKEMIIALTALMLSVSQAFFVNNIRQTAILALVAYLLLAFWQKSQKKYATGLLSLGLVQLVGLFMTDFWVLKVLSLGNLVFGLGLLVWSMMQVFQSEAKLRGKIGQGLLALVAILTAGFLRTDDAGTKYHYGLARCQCG